MGFSCSKACGVFPDQKSNPCEYLVICSLCYTVGPCWLSTLYIVNGFPGGTNGKEPTCQCRRHKRCGFKPWVGKILWRRAWQPIPVFLPGESPWTDKPGRLQSIGLQRVRHNWSDLACNAYYTPSTYLYYNWKFVSFGYLHSIPLFSIPTPTSGKHKSDLFSMSLFLKYSWPTTLCQFLVGMQLNITLK